MVFHRSTTFLVPIALTILASIAGTALVSQYRWRATLRVSAWSVVAVSLLGVALLTLPIHYVQRARVAVVSPTTIPSTIRLRDVSARRVIRTVPPTILLPIEAPITVDSIIRHSEIEVRSAAGREVELAGSGASLQQRFGVGEQFLSIPMSQSDYDALKDSLVSVRLVLVIETFTTRATEPIPLDGSFAIVDGRAQCGSRNTRSILCRTTFGWAGLQYFDDEPVVQLLWSPLRVRFALNPVATVQFGPRSSQDPFSGASLATSVRERLSYTRQEAIFENIRLGDWGP
jgi:hypothetical protein